MGACGSAGCDRPGGQPKQSGSASMLRVPKRARAPPSHNSGQGPWLLKPPEGGSKPRYTLALDVDECLVRAQPTPAGAGVQPSSVTPIRPGSPEALGEPPKYIYPRPGLRELITRLHSLMPKGLEVVLWTTASQHQAHLAWRTIDPEGTCVSQIVWRSAKWVTPDPAGVLVDQATGLRMRCFKNLSLLGRDDMRCLLVDNAPQNCYASQTTSLLIDEFADPRKQAGDKSLFALAELMTRLVESGDEVPAFFDAEHKRGLMVKVKVSIPSLQPFNLRKMRVAALLQPDLPPVHPPAAAPVKEASKPEPGSVTLAEHAPPSADAPAEDASPPADAPAPSDGVAQQPAAAG